MLKESFVFDQDAVTRLKALLSECRHIVIFPHTAPDGDALGSTLGLHRFIRVLYPDAQCTIISPDSIDKYLQWLPGIEDILIWQTQQELASQIIQNADLLIHLDHNVTTRLRYKELVDIVRQSRVKRIMIDHHLEPEQGFDLTFSYPGLSSTCELVYMLLKAMDGTQWIDAQTATDLLTGIVTDTGRLMYGCFYPEVFTHFSELLALGADYPKIIDQLSYHGSESQLRVQGYALYHKLELYPELRTSVITLSVEEQQKLGIQKGDMEGIVNLPLSIEGIDASCLIREDHDQIKLSLRSIGKLPINLVASQGFGGGGHLNAAGAEYRDGGLDVAKKIYLREIKKVIDQD